jgi:hypothetical protein
VGKQDGKGIADPVVELDCAFGGFSLEIRGGLSNLQRHSGLPLLLLSLGVLEPLEF